MSHDTKQRVHLNLATYICAPDFRAKGRLNGLSRYAHSVARPLSRHLAQLGLPWSHLSFIARHVLHAGSFPGFEDNRLRFGVGIAKQSQLRKKLTLVWDFPMKGRRAPIGA